MYKKIQVLSFVLLLLSGLAACKRSADGPSWDVEVLTPLVKSSLSLDNIVTDSLIKANPDSSLLLIYRNDVYSFSPDSFIHIPDTNYKYTYTIPITFTASPGFQLTNSSNSLNFNLNGAEVTDITIKSGYLKVAMSSMIKEKTIFNYSIPEARNSGNSFAVKEMVPAATVSQKGTLVKYYDLSGYVLNLRGPSGNKVNTLGTVLGVQISPDGNDVAISNTDTLGVTVSYVNLIPDFARGYFGQSTYTITPSTVPFTVFGRISRGTLQLDDVNLKLNIKNQIGVDATLHLNYLNSINTGSQKTVSLNNNSVIGNNINISRAQESKDPSQPIIPYTRTFTLNNTNSNIKALVENLPQRLGYSLSVVTDPL